VGEPSPAATRPRSRSFYTTSTGKTGQHTTVADGVPGSRQRDKTEVAT
jgi:hypothetical protein